MGDGHEFRGEVDGLHEVIQLTDIFECRFDGGGILKNSQATIPEMLVVTVFDHTVGFPREIVGNLDEFGTHFKDEV